MDLSSSNRNYGRVLGWLLLLAVAFVVGKSLWFEHRIKHEDLSYTIGEIINAKSNAKGAPSFIFTTQINGKQLKGEKGLDNELALLHIDSLRSYIGMRYFVSYTVDEPHVFRLLLDKPVEDNLLKPSKQGWKRIPDSQDL